MASARNVLFIMIDQLRADCLFGALADHVSLPNLRELTADAVGFRQHYSVTNPCGPSRASILTGQYAMNHRSVRNGTPLRHDTPNIATEMRRAGYLPMLFGYTDTSQDPRIHDPGDPALRSYEQLMHGFHEMIEMRMETSCPWRAQLLDKGYRWDEDQDLYKPVASDGGTPRLDDPALYAAEDSDTAFLTDCFLGSIRACRQKGWFAHLTYIRPHPPLVAPAPYNRMCDGAALPLPVRLDSADAECAIHPFFAPMMQTCDPANLVVGFPELVVDDAAVQTMRAIYLGLATEVDHHIGRIIAFLKASGQYDNTLLLVTADHGEMLGDRYSWGKTSVYDAAYHVPLIVRMPGNGMQAGQVINRPTESIDVVPTILDWVEQPVPNAMDGRSLLPLVQGRAPADWRDCSCSELDFARPGKPTLWERALDTHPGNSNLAILREERFTLIEFAANLPPLLFDRAGQGEMANVAGHSDYQGELARLTRKLLRHRMSNADHTLSNWQITVDGAVLTPRRRG